MSTCSATQNLHHARVRQKRRKIIIAVLLCAVLAPVGAFLLRDNQPRYEGKQLSEWVTLYSGTQGRYPPPDEKQKAGEAIRTIGTNTLPWLLTWLDYEPAAWKLKLGAASQKLPGWIGQSRPFIWLLSSGDAGAMAENARDAFGALGPVASPAIPELARRIRLTNSPARKNEAMFALASIGLDALPAMAGVVANFEREDTLWVVDCVQRMGTNAEPLTPLFMRHLQSTNWFVAMIAARTLGELKFHPELVVPALTRCMSDPRYEVRMETPRALMRFGELAKPALPALLKALNDTNADVRRNAAEAIKTIESGLTNAPPQ